MNEMVWADLACFVAAIYFFYSVAPRVMRMWDNWIENRKHRDD